MAFEIETFDPGDKTLLGPALDALKLPGIIDTPAFTPDMPTNTDGTPKFDYERKQQTWKTDPAVIPGDVTAYKLIGGTDNPMLVDYFVPETWAKIPNIQTNPTRDGVVFPYAARPCRALAADEHFVVVRVGTYFPEVWVRKGEKPVQPPVPGGAGMTAAQEAKLDEVLRRVRALTV